MLSDAVARLCLAACVGMQSTQAMITLLLAPRLPLAPAERHRLVRHARLALGMLFAWLIYTVYPLVTP